MCETVCHDDTLFPAVFSVVLFICLIAYICLNFFLPSFNSARWIYQSYITVWEVQQQKIIKSSKIPTIVCFSLSGFFRRGGKFKRKVTQNKALLYRSWSPDAAKSPPPPHTHIGFESRSAGQDRLMLVAG